MDAGSPSAGGTDAPAAQQRDAVAGRASSTSAAARSRQWWPADALPVSAGQVQRAEARSAAAAGGGLTQLLEASRGRGSSEGGGAGAGTAPAPPSQQPTARSLVLQLQGLAAAHGNAAAAAAAAGPEGGGGGGARLSQCLIDSVCGAGDADDVPLQSMRRPPPASAHGVDACAGSPSRLPPPGGGAMACAGASVGARAPVGVQHSPLGAGMLLLPRAAVPGAVPASSAHPTTPPRPAPAAAAPPRLPAGGVPVAVPVAAPAAACAAGGAAARGAAGRSVAEPAAPKLLYVAVFLTPDSRDVLLSMVPPLHSQLRGDHMALTYRPSGQQLLAAPLGAQAQVGVLGVAANGGVQAAFVEAPAWLQPTNSPAGHITISFARGAQAAEGGVLVRDAMLAAAGAAAAPADIDTSIGGGSGGGGGGRGGNNNSSSSSSYQPWDEELPLLGRVGVRVSLPAATAAQLRASGRLALGPQPQQHQQQRQQQQGEEEVVLYSIEDVAACGCLSLDAAALAHFYTRHAAVLGQQQQPAPAGARRPGDSIAAAAAGGTSALQLSPAPPSSAAAASPGAHTPASTVTAAGAATASPMATSSPPSGGAGLLQLLSSTRSRAATAAAAAAAASGGGTPTAATTPLSPMLAGGDGASNRSGFSSPFLAAAGGPSGVQQQQQQQQAGGSPVLSSCGGDVASADADSDGGDDAVQFTSAVRTGDYVAVRPFAPTAGGARLVQGYVREYACDEPFQARGVLVVLADDTIGFTVAVLGSRGNSSAGAAVGASTRSSSQAAGGAAASPPGAGSSSIADAVLQQAGICSANGPLTWEDLTPAGLARRAAGAAGSSSAAGAAPPPPGAASDGASVSRRRSVRDAQRDLQLWREFDALQRLHGEALCGSILASCNQDFAEAVALITAQASRLGEAAAAAAAAAASKEAGIAAAAKVAEACAAAAEAARRASMGPPGHAAAGWGGDAGSSAAAAAGAVPASDEGYVQQLALSLGLCPTSALQLACLVPHASAQGVVQALQQHGGDANTAADALLSNADAAGASAAAASQQQCCLSAGACASSSSSSSAHARVAASFMAARDADRVAAARQLCAMWPGLTQDMAELLLQEHGDSFVAVADAMSDMHARELGARTGGAAAAGAAGPRSSSSSSSSSESGQRASPGAAAGAAVAAEACHLTEEDQMAIFAALAELEGGQQPQQQQPVAAAAPPFAAQQPQGQLVHSQPPPPQPPRPLPAQQQHQRQQFVPPLVVQKRQQHQQQQQQQQQYEAEQEAKRAAKAAAEPLYDKSRRLKAAADVYTTAAQQLLKDGDEARGREQLARSQRMRAESRAAFDEAQKLSWRANNARSQCWEVDLHGLGHVQALAKFTQLLSMLRGMDHPGGVLFRVVVGQGHHSEGNVPKIKHGVLQYLAEQGAREEEASGGAPWAVTWEVGPANAGVINVMIPAGSGGGVGGGGAE